MQPYPETPDPRPGGEPPFAALARNAGPAPSPLRQAVTAAWRRDETEAVQALLAEAPQDAQSRQAIAARAETLVRAVRAKRSRASGVDALMHEFSLSSEEGVALMCLAEALLRIPDRETADRLIADKISRGDWRRHLGASPSPFVNAASWGLLITGRLVSEPGEGGFGAALTRLIARGGEPLIRKGMDLAMRMLGSQFVTGRTIEEALAHAREREARGYRYSYDMLGEAALTAEDAGRYYEAYRHAIDAIGAASAGRGIRNGPGISVKLSALHPRYGRAQKERVMAELLPRLKALLLQAKRHGIGLNIDAEEADRLELSLDLVEALAFDPELDGFDGLGFVVQAYQKRCPAVIDYLIDLARRSGRRFMVRLVKGAYWDAEIKRAQMDGMPGYPVYTRKVHTDVSYLVCARKLLAAADVIYPQFATHNAHTVAAVHAWAEQAGIEDYEFQCLHGMGESLYDEVVGLGRLDKPCRIYAPVGSHETLLAYLVRRLLENGANTSFVNRIVDDAVPAAELAADPFEQASASGGQPHPKIPLPSDLFGAARRNSAGLDLANDEVLRDAARELARFASVQWQAAPLLAHTMPADAMREVANPADRRDIVGHAAEAGPAHVEAALQAASGFAQEWQQTLPADRAAALERAADLLESNRMELFALAVREAGKSLPNAVGEVREAVDFLRYYAAQTRGMTFGPALGPVACISPWNFPLAIFIGEVSAALAAGNVVLAKPAEQTPLIAARAVRLLHEAGIPRAALQLLPGRGDTVGARLTADPRIRGVIFTGSTEVARHINASLAARADASGELALIAETGGQNAMIVDSSALPEQVVQDAVASAFDSAGQRCSALRVLCLQEDIADRILAMLRGAMRELRIGDPSRLDTDVGPVIDEQARAGLQRHIDELGLRAKSMMQLDLPPACAHGSFVAPALIEISSLSALTREVFGPVLHVLRYRRDDLPALLDAIHATGYGLTLGVQSRIDATISRIAGSARIGNVYVNRNIIGAVVGVQPFGGEGLSGTGPKAGGPLYLHRLHRLQRASEPALGAPADETPAPLRELASWAQRTGRAWLHELCVQYANTTLLDRGVDLPGPTGEANSLRFVPRGDVLCIAAGTDGLLNQIAAALATGNRPQVIAQDVSRLEADLPSSVRETLIVVDAIAPAPMALVEADLQPPWLPRLAAMGEGVTITVATRGCQPIPLWRLVAERALCVNTAAAGGNASLMSLEA
ncbi:L-proline dehydrogenase /delta-1-pyrroline-5-carboxylate dehydrogenase [Noviherbaspirillum humi]|uniref:Bifunctional protein PutA n=1 Tax=Noviherbaspirillum humi TaxID=1688639 RepID=A0A239C1N7_9BURK|nr:bifunctional proline dehydrogenase/L-glutamate gamma-semialdehyde dehydrogenase PutA [Noviherbaspirillum humi]SNS13293.1 L-proline dehydrogenase /delta-1-pyrroline-5-carboxylate dehydrogenase [Noviherbaspirillum humi]